MSGLTLPPRRAKAGVDSSTSRTHHARVGFGDAELSKSDVSRHRRFV